MTTPIWFDSAEAGAPTLNNAAGSTLEVLRACLINGFNSRSVISIVVAGGVATATAETHGFSAAAGKLVLIEGAPEALLNGRKQPGGVTTNTFTFPAPGVADGTYTGTISAKRAPLGWTEPHTGTNVGMFARSAPEATAMLLRVDDTAALDARVVMVESASDVSTFVDHSPTTAQLSGGLFWFKGANNATAKPWAVFGDERLFYIVTPNINGTIGAYSYGIHAFGDPVELFSPDPYCCMLSGAVSSVSSGSQVNRLGLRGQLNSAPSGAAIVLSRAINGIDKSRRCDTVINGGGVPLGSSTQGSTDLSIFAVSGPVLLNDEGTQIRAALPGLADPTARAPFQALPQFSVISSILGTNRSFVSVLFRAQNSDGNALIDVTGPWR